MKMLNFKIQGAAKDAPVPPTDACFVYPDVFIAPTIFQR